MAARDRQAGFFLSENWLTRDNGAMIDRRTLGQRLRDLRRQRGWTLADVSRRTGLAISTISKAERGRIGLAYDKFAALARGLGLDVTELFGAEGQRFGTGALTVTRRGEAPEHETATYLYRMLCTGLRRKRMVPMYGRIKAHDRRDFGEFVRHPGEEFLFVLDGTLDVHLDGEAPIRLKARDAVYFDSSRGHLYVSAGRRDATILVVCSEPGPDARLPPDAGNGAARATRPPRRRAISRRPATVASRDRRR